MITLEQIKAKLLEQPAVQAEYDALAAEFDMARELLHARARAGLTQAQVAERMGTTQSAVARLEGGKSASPPCAPCSAMPKP